MNVELQNTLSWATTELEPQTLALMPRLQRKKQQ